MPVLINFKICDNAKECYGIEACPTHAFHWDEKNKTIAVDDSKCNLCGKCGKSCEVGAIHVARSKQEYERIKKEIDEDPRKISDLFVDRYGAQPIHPAYIVKQDDFKVQILESTILTAVEFFKPDTIECLLCSIPIKDLFEGGANIKYRKMEVKNDSITKKYKVKKLPALLFFNDGELVGKIEGFYDDKQVKEIKNRISKIMNAISILENKHLYII